LMAKGKSTPAPAPEPEAPRESRHLRSSRIIIAEGEGTSGRS
jgi:hypothetical protein